MNKNLLTILMFAGIILLSGFTGFSIKGCMKPDKPGPPATIIIRPDTSHFMALIKIRDDSIKTLSDLLKQKPQWKWLVLRDTIPLTDSGMTIASADSIVTKRTGLMIEYDDSTYDLDSADISVLMGATYIGRDTPKTSVMLMESEIYPFKVRARTKIRPEFVPSNGFYWGVDMRVYPNLEWATSIGWDRFGIRVGYMDEPRIRGDRKQFWFAGIDFKIVR